jgi:EmrB/QacA subfamily drug resistance transporter
MLWSEPMIRAQPHLEPEPLDPRVWRIASVVLLGPLMTALDATVVSLSLARLGQELRSPLATIQWVTSGYLLAMALMLPLCGWLVDRIGAKRVYLLCFTGFTLASLLCGWAASASALIAWRILQGMAGGLLVPMAQMVTVREAGPHVARVMGIMVMPILLGPICGPVLAGFLLQHASWRWIFFINLPVGVLAILAAVSLLPRDAPQKRPRPFDLAGFLLLSPGLVLLLHGLERMGSGHGDGKTVAVELVVALLLLGGFLRHGRRYGAAALVDLELFRSHGFSAAATTQFLANAINYGGQFLLPLYLLVVCRTSPSRAGVLLIPGGLGMLCSMPFVGRLTEKYGSKHVSAGGALLALIGTLPFAWPAFASVPAWTLGLAFFLRGAGLGTIGIPSIAVAYSGIPREAIPMATTTLNIVQRLGGPVAITALAIFLHMRMAALRPSGGPLAAHAFSTVFVLLAILHTGALVAALRLPAQSEAGRSAAAPSAPNLSGSFPVTQETSCH